MILGTSASDELTTDVPRAANFKTSTHVSRLFLLLLLFFVVGFVWWLADCDLGDLNTLKAHGRTTLAHVVGRHISHGKSDCYYLDYTFDGDGIWVDGIWVDGMEGVGEDEYRDTRRGTAIEVTFLPSRPETYRLGTVTPARIEAQRSRWLWGELGAFVLFGLLLIGMEATYRQHLSLLRDGLAVEGTVTDRSPGPVHKAFCVTYQFMVDGRFAVESRSYSNKVTCSQLFYEKTELGQPLTVLYNPACPSQNIPYRMLTDVILSKQ